MKTKISIKAKPKIKPKIKIGIKLAGLLSMNEKEFREILREIEQEPIFLLLKKEKIIKPKRFSKTASCPPLSLEIIEEAIPYRKEKSIEPLLEEKKDAVELIKQLGADKFKEYFWDNEEMLNIEEIMERTGLSINQIKAVNSFIDEYELATLTSQETQVDSINYTKIASIEEDLSISFFLRDMARGTYSIDKERLTSLKNKISNEDLKKASEMIGKIEETNTRKTIIYQLLKQIIEAQKGYLKTGKPEDLSLLTQTSVAERIGVGVSSISRAIYGRAIETQWGEKPLKFFFPSKKKKIALIIRKIIQEKQFPLSDEKLKAKLRNDYGISVSRRQITKCRNEMKIPSSRKSRPL